MFFGIGTWNHSTNWDNYYIYQFVKSVVMAIALANRILHRQVAGCVIFFRISLPWADFPY